MAVLWLPPERSDVLQRPREAHALIVEHRRIRYIGGREMRIHGVELEVRAREQFWKRSLQVVEPKAEPVHAGVDLEVIPDPLLVFQSRGLNRAGGSGRGDGRRELAVEQAVEIAHAHRAEHED